MADAGRVIAGSARGIRLRAPGDGTRPLGDRVKQTLFAILEPRLRGARVVDLFAGSGAGGIEALSRGAMACWFLERDAGAVRVISENLERAGLAGPAATVVRADAIEWLSRSAPDLGPFDVILVDPPYAQPDLLIGALRRLGDAAAPPILAPDGIVVAKHFWRSGPPAVVGLLASERERRFGETALTFYRRKATDAEGR
jgi:16S rRNA (guanine(966)-N(2))-methyltransferase RsmD